MCSTPDAPAPTPPTAPVVAPKAMALPDNDTPLGLAALRIGGQGLSAADAVKKAGSGPKTPVVSPLTIPTPQPKAPVGQLPVYRQDNIPAGDM